MAKTSMATPLFTIILFLASCNDNTLGERHKTGDRLLEDPEHHIKDSPDILKHDGSVLYTGWYYVVDTPNGYKRQLDKSDETYYLDPEPITTAKNVTTFEIYESSYNGKKYYGLTMRLDKDRTKIGQTLNQHLTILVQRLTTLRGKKVLIRSRFLAGPGAHKRRDFIR